MADLKENFKKWLLQQGTKSGTITSSLSRLQKISATEKGLMSKEPNYNPKFKNYGKICPIKGNKEYVYLRCRHQKGDCCQKLVNENTILEQLGREIFHQIHISPAMHELLKQSITAILEDEKKINASVRKKNR